MLWNIYTMISSSLSIIFHWFPSKKLSALLVSLSFHKLYNCWWIICFHIRVLHNIAYVVEWFTDIAKELILLFTLGNLSGTMQRYVGHIWLAIGPLGATKWDNIYSITGIWHLFDSSFFMLTIIWSWSSLFPIDTEYLHHTCKHSSNNILGWKTEKRSLSCCFPDRTKQTHTTNNYKLINGQLIQSSI